MQIKEIVVGALVALGSFIASSAVLGAEKGFVTQDRNHIEPGNYTTPVYIPNSSTGELARAHTSRWGHPAIAKVLKEFPVSTEGYASLRAEEKKRLHDALEKVVGDSTGLNLPFEFKVKVDKKGLSILGPDSSEVMRIKGNGQVFDGTGENPYTGKGFYLEALLKNRDQKSFENFFNWPPAKRNEFTDEVVGALQKEGVAIRYKPEDMVRYNRYVDGSEAVEYVGRTSEDKAIRVKFGRDGVFTVFIN